MLFGSPTVTSRFECGYTPNCSLGVNAALQRGISVLFEGFATRIYEVGEHRGGGRAPLICCREHAV